MAIPWCRAPAVQQLHQRLPLPSRLLRRSGTSERPRLRDSRPDALRCAGAARALDRPVHPRRRPRYEAPDVLWPLVRDATPVFTMLPLIATAYAYRLRLRWATIAAFGVAATGQLLLLRERRAILPRAASLRRRGSRTGRGAGLGVRRDGGTRAGHLPPRRERGVERDERRGRRRAACPPVRAMAPSSCASCSPLSERSGPMLVFVRNPPLAEPLLIALSPLNFSPFPGPIVVARDLGRENASLICRMPGRARDDRRGGDARSWRTTIAGAADSTSAPVCRAPALSTLTRIRG